MNGSFPAGDEGCKLWPCVTVTCPCFLFVPY
jgi:hypothetical protein